MGKIYIEHLYKLKNEQEKIACLTAYDASQARATSQAGIEVILVGDSLGMVCKGNNNTLSVTIDEISYHTKSVSKYKLDSLIMADLPFMTYTTPQSALENSHKLICCGAEMVKIEGGESWLIEIVEYLSLRGILVCGHLGLLPQYIYAQGGYKKQATTAKEADKLLQEAIALERAGIKLLVLECVPAEVAEKISKKLKIPVIGIGTYSHCDGQILVFYDLIGLSPNTPKFAKNFLVDNIDIHHAIKQYVKDIKDKQFPVPVV